MNATLASGFPTRSVPDGSGALIIPMVAAVISCLVPLGNSPRGYAGQPDGRTIAVMAFADTSANDQAKGFNRALQEMLTTDLSVSRDVRVVERPQLEEVLKEQKLGKTEFLDQASAARVGKGLGAQAVLTGSLWVKDRDMRIDARLVHVETGEIILPAKVVGTTDSFLDLEKEMATSIVEALGARLSAFEKASLAKRHTSDIKAATAFGQALEAEDTGNAAVAREKAAVALQFDPDFAMAEVLVREIDTLLEDMKSKDSRQRALFLASFEARLLDWPLEGSPESVARYRDLLKHEGPKRALFHWMQHQTDKQFSDAIATPYSMLFVRLDDMSNDRGAGQSYLQSGAGDVMNFWCDVVQSDPALAPKRRLRDEEINPDWRTLPAQGKGNAYYLWMLPDIYWKRFCAAVNCGCDIGAAATIAQECEDVCGGMGTAATLYPELEDLRRKLADDVSRQSLQKDVTNRRMRWSIMEDEIIAVLAGFQVAEFRTGDLAPAAPEMNEVRRRFEQELIDSLPPAELFGGAGAQRSAVRQMIKSLTKETEGCDFVAIPAGNETAAASGTMMTHLVGCPDSIPQSRRSDTMSAPSRPKVKLLRTADECVGPNLIPCGRCRPLRWANPDSAKRHMATIGKDLLRRAIEQKEKKWPWELEQVLEEFIDTPTEDLRKPLSEFCRMVAMTDDPDRERQALAFRCLATVVDENDIGWLAEILSGSPFFDVRANVGAVLGAIGGPEAVDSITAAVEREPYYFVRHSLEASKRRASAR